MPLVRIALLQERTESQRALISDAVHQALVETISIPSQDRFQIITSHSLADFVFDPSYLGIDRTKDLVVIQVVISVGRTLEIRKALFQRIAELLSQHAGVRQEDVMISLVEVPKENWSFGNGEAQYVVQ